MEENHNKENWLKKHKMGVFGGVSAVLMLIGLSYAWLQLTLRGTKELTILTAGSLELELDDTMTGGISFTEAVPVSNEEGTSQDGYTFTLENKGNVVSDYTIYLDDLNLTEGQTRMNDSFIKYQLTKDGSEVDLQLLDKTGASPNRVLESGTIAPKTKYTYVLKMWIDENATNAVMETMFKGQLRIEAMQTIPKTLYTEIAKSAVLDNIQSKFVTATTGIDFGQISSDTNGKGVYTLNSTKDDAYPVHYYRGAVTNNNVKFAGLCWKIVRTTSTGGVKLIYNGSTDANGYCTNTTGDETQIGTSKFNETGIIFEEPADYMVNNTTDSAIKGVIDTWYQANMTEFTNKLEDTVWCNDRSSSGGSYPEFGAFDRVYTTHHPSLTCANDEDKFTVDTKNGNGLLTYPVALLTADEVMLAGGLGNTTNSSYYLYTNQRWWTLSPSYGDLREALIMIFGVLDSSILGDEYYGNESGVRPSVSLAPNTKFTSGDGTMNNPYII